MEMIVQFLNKLTRIVHLSFIIGCYSGTYWLPQIWCHSCHQAVNSSYGTESFQVVTFKPLQHLFPCDLNAALAQVMGRGVMWPSAALPLAYTQWSKYDQHVSLFPWHPKNDCAYAQEIHNNGLLSSSEENHHSGRPISWSASRLASILHPLRWVQ